jgi:translation initiation factor 3 subunit L
VGEYGVRPLYRMLGYFSIIGLLRVHVLLGDFTLALKVMENVDLNQKVRVYIVLLFYDVDGDCN